MESKDESSRLEQMLASRDLTEPAHGGHRFQALVTRVHESVAEVIGCSRQLLRLPPWESSGFGERRRPRPRAGLVGGVCELLASQALDPPNDRLVVSPGPVLDDRGYRHELMLARVSEAPVTAMQLATLVRAATAGAGVTSAYRLLPERNRLAHGLRLEVQGEAGWQAIGRCGLASTDDLVRAGLDSRGHGAAVICFGLEALDAVLGGRDEAPQTACAAAAG
ncbi:hypothetical protein [Arhodomonas sp. AD133]|uniref:hypothetical protein n=1 Tax=Arhodomonas sp. AD133 TaxID=3415009 RepID=UPI003EBFD053